MRTRPGWVEPEVWFRIVHVAGDGRHSAPMAAYRELRVEIALGPKGAFENGNIGFLTLQVQAARVVSAAPPRRDKLKPSKVAKTPRVAELLRKAIDWRRQLDAGEVLDQADIARQEGVTRARVTQVMGLLRLAPEIQEQIQSLTDITGRPPVTERLLRPIGTIADPHIQLLKFNETITATSNSPVRT